MASGFAGRLEESPEQVPLYYAKLGTMITRLIEDICRLQERDGRPERLIAVRGHGSN